MELGATSQTQHDASHHVYKGTGLISRKKKSNYINTLYGTQGLK